MDILTEISKKTIECIQVLYMDPLYEANICEYIKHAYTIMDTERDRLLILLNYVSYILKSG